jgi:3-hydroxyisobutyrate dehydrogenase-like beta-hydroxyacid dehydrogenase
VDIGLIGYGEVGRILAEDLRAKGHRIVAFDIKLGSADDTPLSEHAAKHGVRLARSHPDAVRGAELVISAVTAEQTVVAAEACAADGLQGFFLDLNSASPAAKVQASRLIDSVGGRFVEGAVMAAVPPYRSQVPLLLGGRHAEALAPALSALGFAAKVASSQVGVASATKMCRSVVIKGLEALLIESLTAARHYGVEDAVIASLAQTFPSIDWEPQATYTFARVLEHGRRRAEELQQAAQCVRAAGLTPWLAAAIAERQAWVADLADRGVFGARSSTEFAHSSDWRLEADRILAQVAEPEAHRA